MFRPALQGLLLALALAGLGTATATGADRPWTKARSWLYQLQRAHVADLVDSPYDLFVIDPCRVDDPRHFRPKEEVERLKRAGGRRRLVVAYVSIGEAEPYRYYWKPGWKPGSPAWLDTPNPDWPDNYRVRYWDPAWQKIIFDGPGSYVDRVMAAGFDGLYLDIVDGYERYQKERPSARDDMKRLVAAIAKRCRSTPGNEDFGIFPQNAVELLEDPAYAEILTGIGKEETYFFATDEATSAEDRNWEEELLGAFARKGKLVLCVDYVTEPEGKAYVAERCRKFGFLSLCTDVELDRDPGARRAP